MIDIKYIKICYITRFSAEQGSKEIEERSPEKEKRKAKLKGDERKERKMSRKRVSIFKALTNFVGMATKLLQ